MYIVYEDTNNTMTNYIDTLPTELQDIIYFNKHKLELNDSLKKITVPEGVALKVTDGIRFDWLFESMARQEGMMEQYYFRPEIWDYTTIVGLVTVFSCQYAQSKLKYRFYDQKSKTRISIYKKTLLRQLFDDNNKKFVKSKSVTQLVNEWLKF